MLVIIIMIIIIIIHVLFIINMIMIQVGAKASLFSNDCELNSYLVQLYYAGQLLSQRPQ